MQSFSQRRMLLLFVIVCLHFFSVALSVCPAGWAQREHRCYFIFSDKLNRSEATNLCDLHSAQLVDFASETEWDYLMSLLLSARLDSGTWTGLMYNGSSWTWGYSVSSQYTELYHWEATTDSLGDAAKGANLVPTPDPKHRSAKLIISAGQEMFLVPEAASMKLYPFCVRDFDAAQLCDVSDDWVIMLELCYKLYPPATWNDAVNICGAAGGNILLPEWQEQLTPVSSLVGVNLSAWIGVTYRDPNYYSPGNMPINYLPWLTPTSDYKHTNKTCVAAMHSVSMVGYYTETCSVELSFICMRSAVSCPLGWYQDGSSCFRLHIRPEERVTWIVALERCRGMNADLAENLSAEANALLYNVLLENDVHLAWLGFSGSDSHYKYVNGLNVWGNYYLLDTTNVRGGPQRCGVTDFDPRRNGLSMASYCFTPRPFVCTSSVTGIVRQEATANISCDADWTFFNDVCYKLVMSPMTYASAVDNCVSMGAAIVAVNDTVQQSFFSTSLFMSFGEEYYWIGVEFDTELNYYTLHGDDQEVQFWNFDPNQVLTNTSTASCVYVSSGSNPPFIGSWFAEDCGEMHNSVCQKPAKQAAVQTSTPQTVWSLECGVGWTYSNVTNFCYFISPYSHKPWREAQSVCQGRHGNLLSILGEDEQKVIEDLLKSDVYKSLEESLWIGAGDVTVGNGWGWSDSRPFSFLNWAEDEPQYDSDDGDNCAYIPVTKLFQWETRSCGDQLGFICTKPASPASSDQTPTTPPSSSCQPQPLISGQHSIQFPQDFSSSSYKDAQHTPDRCRMVPFNNASWSPANDSTKEWLAITFHSPVTISDIEMRGEDSTDKYVTKFKLQYQYDSTSPWYWLLDTDRSVLVFDGVTAPDSSAAILLPGELQAHAIKIWPVEWSYGIAIQLEINGCPEEECSADYAMSGPLFVDDRSIAASTESPGFESWNARLKPTSLNQQLTAWMPYSTEQTPWIQVDLGQVRIIQGVTIAGDQNGNHVTQFQIMLSQGPRDEFITYAEPYGVPHSFSATLGIGQTMTVFLQSSVEARLVRIVLQKWQGKAALKFDVLVCKKECRAEPMIANLPTGQLTASDSSDHHNPGRSKLYTQRSGEESDCWMPLQGMTVDKAYIQVDLSTVMQITAVATQGSETENSWVTSYYLAFSSDGQNFQRYGGNLTCYIRDSAVTEYTDSVVYQGNFDGSTVVKNELAQPVNARYVQLWPHAYHTAVALRWEVYACSKHTSTTSLGCYADDPADPDLPYIPWRDQYSSIWPEACLTYCYDKGYHYAGLQNGDLCSCGNLYGMYGVTKGCNISCQDPYSNFTCGGLNQNMVYSTGISANSLKCPAGWTPYRDSCYSLIDQDTWSNAEVECKNMGAHLVDISDRDENDLVASIVGDDSWREFVTVNIGQNAWIGLNDIQTNLNFEWSTGEDVNYTNWGHHQPTVNPGLEQHVVMISPDGSWTNTFINDVNSFICETEKKPSTDPATVSPSIGCLPGWKAGNLKCYQFYRQKKTWSEAQNFCVSQGSTLARSDTSKENIVLAASLSELDGKYWLDIHDENSTGLYTHSSAKLDILFTNWDTQKPGSGGRCVSMQTAQRSGVWLNEECEGTNRFVCEQPRTDVLPPFVVTPQNTKHTCPAGWLMYGANCYQFNVPSTSSLLTWHEANENCKQQDAVLASFHSDTLFDEIMSNLSKGLGNFWIGLNSLDSLAGFSWSDGSVMNFVRWGDGQPSTGQPLTFCGEVLLDTATMGLQFCSERRNWICSIQQGKSLANISTVQPPYTYEQCRPLDNWWKYKNYCYYVSTGQGGTDDALTWRESREWCQKHGGDLASITEADENAYIHSRLNQGIPVEAAWIGLNELDQNSGYSWSDGTPLGSSWELNWNVNEPDDYNGYEGCVEILARNGRWNDFHCSTRQGFICKQPAPGTNVTKPVPAKRPNGNCPPNFSRLGYKCFRLMGIDGDLDSHTWADARLICQHMLSNRYINYTIDLASITTQEENCFLATLLNQYRRPAWIGLKRLASGQYAWADNEDLGFEGWNKGEPNMAPGNDSCVYMYGTSALAGKWSDVSCEEKSAFICQGFVDPSFPAVTVPPTSQCNVTDGFQQFGSSCYKVINQTVTWPDARASCQASKAYLATIMDGFDWAEMYLLIRGYVDGVWIGLNDLKLRGQYVWDSGYPVTYTRWTHHQPQDVPDGACVHVDSSGMYNSSSCANLRAYVCRMDTKPPDITPQPLGSFCNSRDFTLLGSACYLLVLDTHLTYDNAGRECQLRGATLASIHNPSLTFNIPAGRSVWIGLRESETEGFGWEDTTVLDYTHWSVGKPSWSGDEAVEEGCVALTSAGDWVNVNCDNKNGYLCAKPAATEDSNLTVPPVNETVKTPATPTTATTQTPSTYSQETPPSPWHATSPYTTTFSHSLGLTSTSQTSTQTSAVPVAGNDTQGLSGGDVAGIVMGIIAAAIITIILIFAIRQHCHLRSSFLRREASKVKNFENSLYAETRKDTLTKPECGEVINIYALDSDPRELTVSYTVPHTFEDDEDALTSADFSTA